MKTSLKLLSVVLEILSLAKVSRLRSLKYLGVNTLY